MARGTVTLPSGKFRFDHYEFVLVPFKMALADKVQVRSGVEHEGGNRNIRVANWFRVYDQMPTVLRESMVSKMAGIGAESH